MMIKKFYDLSIYIYIYISISISISIYIYLIGLVGARPAVKLW